MAGATRPGSPDSALASRVGEVTLYREGALVTRAAELRADAEGSLPGEVRIPGLPLSLDDDSVRVRVEPAAGEADARAPVATELRVVLDVPPQDATLAPPKDEELEAARREVASLRDRGEQLSAEAERARGISLEPRPEGKRGEPPGPSPTDARLRLLEFRRRELERLSTEVRETSVELRRARERLDELEHRRRLASTARQARENELRKAAVVRLKAPDGGAAPAAGNGRWRILLEYLVPGARWAPGYAVRFSPDFARADLAVRAVVCQRSGEDWNGVKLRLSTADAMAWTELPELPSLRIGRRQPSPPRVGYRAPPEGAEALYADYDRARAALTPAETEPETEAVELRDAATGADLEGVADFWGASEVGEVLGELSDDAISETRQEEETTFGSLLVGAGPERAPAAAPPPPAQAARPAAPRMAAMRARGGAALARAAGAIARRKSRRPPTGAMPAATAAAVPEAAPEEEAALGAPAALLRFGNLRLAGADDPSRGRLRPVAEDVLYREMLASVDVSLALAVEVSVETSVVEWIRSARTRARDAADAPLPAGHSHPGAEGGFDYAYECGGPVDVPSDGAYHSLPVAERRAETRMRYVVVPRASRDAFRQAAFVNPLQAPLLAGPADVYIGDRFALTAPLATVAPGGEAVLGLGVEQGIKVARNTGFTEHAEGLLGGKLGLEHEITVEVANNLARAAEVEVRERVPSAREGDDEVEVDVTGAEPAWERFDQRASPIPGSYRWRITVEPGARRTLRARYVVRLPSKKEIVGGNRREQ